MDIYMKFFVGNAITVLESAEEGYTPPTFEISRAIEHYRKSKRMPIPHLLNTKFLFYSWQSNKVYTTDEGYEDSIDEEVTDVILCNREGIELQLYRFTTYGRMEIIKTKKNG